MAVEQTLSIIKPDGVQRNLIGDIYSRFEQAGLQIVAARIDDQGVRVQLSADVNDGSITAMRFLAWGCPHVIAAAEAVCSDYEGRAVSDLDDFSAAELMQSLAVPAEKSGRILVIEDAVRSLGAMLRGISGSRD